MAQSMPAHADKRTPASAPTHARKAHTRHAPSTDARIASTSACIAAEASLLVRRAQREGRMGTHSIGGLGAWPTERFPCRCQLAQSIVQLLCAALAFSVCCHAPAAMQSRSSTSVLAQTDYCCGYYWTARGRRDVQLRRPQRE
jgi:hypothetical protein